MVTSVLLSVGKISLMIITPGANLAIDIIEWASKAVELFNALTSVILRIYKSMLNSRKVYENINLRNGVIARTVKYLEENGLNEDKDYNSLKKIVT